MSALLTMMAIEEWVGVEETRIWGRNWERGCRICGRRAVLCPCEKVPWEPATGKCWRIRSIDGARTGPSDYCTFADGQLELVTMAIRALQRGSVTRDCPSFATETGRGTAGHGRTRGGRACLSARHWRCRRKSGGRVRAAAEAQAEAAAGKPG